ncbi:hypothetical protein BGZ94_000680, partial [Podila epigama]
MTLTDIENDMNRNLRLIRTTTSFRISNLVNLSTSATTLAMDKDFIPLESPPLESSDDDIEIDMDNPIEPKKNKNTQQAKVVPKHYRKSNPTIYDNISVYAPPDSNLIFRCSRKKADWYLTRNLARSLSPTSIHLTFSPAGQGRAGESYFLEARENKCVVCGKETAEAGATMLHVVPEQYRKWFPIRLKSHSSHDILVACPECNALWDREAASVRKRIVALYKVPLEGVGWVRDYEAGGANRAAGAIIAEWARRWDGHRIQHERQSKSHQDTEQGSPVPSKTEMMSNTASGIEKGAGTEIETDTGAGSKDVKDMNGTTNKADKKAKKVKKQGSIPLERLQALENIVLTWWNQLPKEDKDMESMSLKRTTSDDPENESLECSDVTESRKRTKTEAVVDTTTTMTTTGSSKTLPPVLSEATSNVSTTETLLTKKETRKIPLPPPVYTTMLDTVMLERAMDAQALYKAPDYREHGQIVVSRVMASSPEFHEDANESTETLESWRIAEPLAHAPEGWRDVNEFVRTWRQAFLDRIRPRHLSAEWRPENPSLEPILKDVIPFHGDWDSAHMPSIVLDDLLHQNYLHHDNSDRSDRSQSDSSMDHPSLSFSQRQQQQQQQQQQHPAFEHSRLLGLGGAAGVGTGFRPSVFQAMLAERYLKLRTPSPAVLLQLQVILSYLQNEKLCVL